MTKGKKAAMEMSVGTIVTIVLLVTVLVLGLVLVRTVFSTGTDAVDQIDSALQNQINELFASEGNLVVYPASRELTLERGDTPKGFAFSVRNDENMKSALFTYDVSANDISRCGDFSKSEANQMLIASSGSFNLGAGDTLEIPQLVKFDVPETTPLCTIVYKLAVTKTMGGTESPYSSAQIFVTIK